MDTEGLNVVASIGLCQYTAVDKIRLIEIKSGSCFVVLWYSQGQTSLPTGKSINIHTRMHEKIILKALHRHRNYLRSYNSVIDILLDWKS